MIDMYSDLCKEVRGVNNPYMIKVKRGSVAGIVPNDDIEEIIG